ncbi:MAG TPA: cytochrome c [Rhodanobacteraceae bacterium]|nr:cytochrome c [Rhodanobacteraceae bacterium]
MSVQLSQSDRTYMRHFFIGIVMLAIFTVVDIAIATVVMHSLPVASSPEQARQADLRITPVGAVYAGASGQAALVAAAPALQPSAAATGPYTFNESEGKSLFDSTCAACHQATGEGVPGTFPPLKGNAAVNDADAKTQIETILDGRQGTVIGGQKYSGVMPPFGSQLTDTQIANVANYERSAWGNHGKHVTADDVAALRKK